VFQPIVTEELIKKLQETFPGIPLRSMSHREIDQLIGNQEVIAYLQMLLEESTSETPNLEEV